MMSARSMHNHLYLTGRRERTGLVSQIPHRLAEAWNRHDMEAAFDDFDDDADFVGMCGERWRGYDEIVAQHARLHHTVLAQTELRIDDVLLRTVSVESAYVIAGWTLRRRAGTANPGTERRGSLMLVVARQGSAWRVFSAQVSSSRYRRA